MKNFFQCISIRAQDFCHEHKKTILFCMGLFLAGFMIGIAIIISSYGGKFEKIFAGDMVKSAVKMFFVFFGAEIGMFCCFVFVNVGSFFVVLTCCGLFFYGYWFSRYAVILCACFGGNGILAFVFVYVPYFLLSMLIFVVAICLIFDASTFRCRNKSKYGSCARHKSTSSQNSSLKIALCCFLISMCKNVIIFFLGGLIFPVIVI